jgi:hypothetical protein
MTYGLEGRRSIQLSYGRCFRMKDQRPKAVGLQCQSDQSGRSDLNRGPPAPKAGALTGLRYAPLTLLYLPVKLHGAG